MASSLDSLVKNLGKDKLHRVRREFGEKTPLISRKGVYPYDWMNSFVKFSEEKLPPKEKFFNRLNETHISDEDYAHAQNVWEKFSLKNIMICISNLMFCFLLMSLRNSEAFAWKIIN